VTRPSSRLPAARTGSSTTDDRPLTTDQDWSRSANSRPRSTIDGRPAMANRVLKPASRRPARRGAERPAIQRHERHQRHGMSQHLTLKRFASTAQNAVQRRGCAVLRRVLRRDRVSTCRLYRLSGSIRSGDTAIAHRVLEVVLLGAIRLTINLILRGRRRWEFAATCPSLQAFVHRLSLRERIFAFPFAASRLCVSSRTGRKTI
jgi:hypothetical protein